MRASMWLGTTAQRCLLVRAVYLSVADSLRRYSCETFLLQLGDRLMWDLHTPQQSLQVCYNCMCFISFGNASLSAMNYKSSFILVFSTGWLVILPSAGPLLPLCRSKVGLSDLGEFLCSLP